MDRKVLVESWDPEKDNLMSLISVIRGVFEKVEIPKEDVKKVALCVKASIDQVFVNPPEVDIFSPCMSWTPELISFKKEIILQQQ
jgi:hypothetical protein